MARRLPKIEIEKEFTKAGNEILRGFSMAGCSGTEYNIMQKLEEKGYKTLYNEACYYWGMYNPSNLRIYTYTEGDTALIQAKTKKSFMREVENYSEFLKKQGYQGPEYRMGEIEKEIGLVVE